MSEPAEAEPQRGWVAAELAEEFPGLALLELTVENDAAWHQVWQQFKAGA